MGASRMAGRPGAAGAPALAADAESDTQVMMAPSATETGEASLGGDDLEMAELRALAAEIVRAGGGVPRSVGYRPRLEPGRRATVVVPMIPQAGSWSLVAWVRGHPLPTVAVGVGLLGALAGVLVLGGHLGKLDDSLELEAAPPPPPRVATFPAPAPRAPTPGALREGIVPARPVDRPPARRTGKGRTTLAKEGSRSSTARMQARNVAGALDREAITEGMQSIQPLVRACYREHREKGVASVAVEVGKGGRVKKVKVAGPLAGTRSAGCVKAAVKKAHFEGVGNFRYPLVLQ
jgi:hypothetical protein